MKLAPIAFAILALAATPLAAQSTDFGDDSSQWANDGECDDPRFIGPGMTTTPLLDADIGHDATDCRTAFQGERITLRGDVPMSVPGGKGAAAAAIAADLVIGGINYGNDSGEYTRDGECDDRRFVGPGMASSISWKNMGADATDCAAAVASGTVHLWNYVEAHAATVCAAIDFGDDSGTYPNDRECDDGRFEGPGVAMALNSDEKGHDASDCSRLCAYGVLALRDY